MMPLNAIFILDLRARGEELERQIIDGEMEKQIAQRGIHPSKATTQKVHLTDLVWLWMM